MRKRAYGAAFRSHAVALAVAVLAGCGGRGQPEVQSVRVPSDCVLSLIGEFGSAKVEREVGVIDLGTSEARGHLGEGWSYDERGRLGWTGVWAMGPRSVVRFFVGEPHDIELELKCSALPASLLGPQITTVIVNDQSVGSLTIRSDRGGHYRIAVPEADLQVGENTLAFDFAWSARPADVLPDSGDRRLLSVMFDEIMFDGLLDAEEPEILGAGASEYLWLPPRSSVSFYEEAPSNSSLWIGGVTSERAVAKDSCVLEIGIATESGPGLTEVVQPLAVGSGPVRLELGSDHKEIVGIRFSARPQRGDESCRTALRVVEPSIIAAPASSTGLDSKPGEIAPPWAGAQQPPNILIYLIDCLRADHLGVYGYSRGVSPNIDRFAGDSVVFDHAMSASSWTRPSVASLLSGLSPQSHGTRGDRDALSESVPLVQEILQGEGYATAAVVTNGVVSAKFGFGRGFDDFRYLPEQHKTNPEIHQLSNRVNSEVIEWLGNRDTSRPFFMYVHSTDPHAPYLPRSPYREEFAPGVDPKIGLHPAVEALTQGRAVAGPDVRQGLIRLYDGEIAYNDDRFGRLLKWLKSEGLYDNTLIVLTADHGEEFGDHGRWQHGFTLYQEMLHVPLVVKEPAGHNADRRRADLVSLIDVAPTLLKAVGINPPTTMMGRSLRPWDSQDAPTQADRPVFADLAREPQWRAVDAVISGRWGLIQNRNYDLPRPAWELYDLEKDADERRNLAGERPVIAGFLGTLLRQAAAVDRHAAPTAVLSPEDEEKLRALGYLQ